MAGDVELLREESSPDLIDEETRPLSPGVTGIQLDSYNRSKLVVYCCNFAIAWDSFATFLTIFYYWATLGGAFHLYGFVYSSYALAQAIGAPFLGFWADKRSIREVMMASLLLDIIGNITYALAMCSETWLGQLTLLAGRVIAGSAAGLLTVGLSYVCQLSSHQDRLKAMNIYRVSGFLGRMLSALAGVFLLLVKPVNLPGTTCSLNPYTAPSMVTITFDTIALVLAFFFLKPLPVRKFRLMSVFEDVKMRRMLRDANLLNITFLAACVAMWTIFSQMQPLAIMLYGIVPTGDIDSALPYVPAFLGLTIGWAIVLWPLSKITTDRTMMLYTPIIVVLSLFGFFRYSTSSPNPKWIFYIATTVLFTAFNVFNTAYQSYYSKVVGDTHVISTMLSLLLITGSLGNFLGPFVSSIFLGYSGAADCCNPAQHCYKCCQIQGVNILVALVIVFLAGCNVFLFLFVRWREQHMVVDTEEVAGSYMMSNKSQPATVLDNFWSSLQTLL